jgi:hypothetical protein
MNGVVSLALSALDVRVLRATDARYERSPEWLVNSRAARRMWRCLRCAGSAAPTSSRTTAAARNGGFARIEAMSRWSTSREPDPGRNCEPVSESLTG